MNKKEFRIFEESRKFVRELGLKDQKEWELYCKSSNRPKDIATRPDRVYKNQGWVSLGDWLGTRRIANQNKKYLSFVEAKKFAQSLGLKDQKEWHEYCKSGKKPDNIPSTPERKYKKDWISWGDFLGTGNISNRYKIFCSFVEAKKFAQSLGLKGQKEWESYCKLGNIPNHISPKPSHVYKNKGWISWGDFLGTGNISSMNKHQNYLAFEDARNIARKLSKKYNIKTWNDWKKAVKEGKIPDNIPGRPEITYSKNERKRNEKRV